MEEPSVSTLKDCIYSYGQGLALNTSDVTPPTNDQFYGLIFLTTNILLVPPILCGNLLVIIAIYRFEQLRSTTNFFILSLSVSDLLVGVLAPYFSLIHYTDLGLNKQKYHCLLGFCLMMLTCGTSMTNLVGISIERYISIRYPLEYVRWVTPFRVKIAITIIWLYGFIFAGLPIFWNTWEPGKMCRYAYVYPKGYLYCLMIFTVTFLIITAVLYFQVFRIAKRVQAEIQKSEKRFSQDAHRYRRQARIAKVLGMVLGCYYGCYFPFLTMTAVKVSLVNREPLPVYIIAQICCSLVFSNSCFNFLIYACKSNDFKKGFRKMFGCNNLEAEYNMDIESN